MQSLNRTTIARRALLRSLTAGLILTLMTPVLGHAAVKAIPTAKAQSAVEGEAQSGRSPVAPHRATHSKKKKKKRQHGGKSGVQPRAARRAASAHHLAMPATEASPLLDVAAQFLGRPYRFGASAGAYDCSGFVRRVFGEIGIALPHSAREQFGIGDHVPRHKLEPGDLVFFRTYRRDASHVGIYCGNDQFIHAATRGGQVQVDSLDQPYYTRRYLGARRIPSADVSG